MTDKANPQLKVCKFGGSSLADLDAFQRMQAIVDADPARRIIVPSAPGKRHAKDQKVTDLLYLCHQHAESDLPIDDLFGRITARFAELCEGVGAPGALDEALDDIRRKLEDGASAAFAASRGEFLNGKLVATLLEAECIDAADVICFDRHGHYDAKSTQVRLRQRLPSEGRVVIPGFYGSRPDGTIETFSRGGSDVTGAIVAQAAGADVYENWTDVPGLLMADPGVVPSPLPIETLTYRELRELAYMGARVLHDEAIFPVREAGIPVNIRSTLEPNHPGTMIVRDEPVSIIVPEGDDLKRIDHADRMEGDHPDTPRIKPVITGIAGRRDFTVITLAKALMNKHKGFGSRVLEVVDDYDISWEHMPSGIDTLSLVLESEQVKDQLDALVEDLRGACSPDDIEVSTDIALIATVGRGMMHTPGISGRLFSALSDAGVNVRMIDQGSGELNIIVGVHVDEYETAVRAIYDCFVGTS